jgi:hypothetical protein
MRLLVIDRGLSLGSPEGHQALPFLMYRKELQAQLGITVDQVTCMELAEIEQAVKSRPADVALVMIPWSVSLDQAIELLRHLQHVPDRPRIVLMDYFAPTGSPFFPALPYVDAYVKRQLLKDRGRYLSDFKGGLIFTDFLVNQLGYDLKGWNFGSKADPAQMHKVVVGWNLGMSPLYRSRLKITRHFNFAWRLRYFDIHQRFTPPGRGTAREWYEEYRQLAALKLRNLNGRYRMTGSGRINYRLYILELLSSKVVVSPFGWGEVCFRDYEAIIFGALLIKPSMEHLQTYPDIYRPYETYVPVRWDLEDLEETCKYYLDHPAESLKIIKNAQKALSDYYEQGGLIEQVRDFVHVATRDSASSREPPELAGKLPTT